MCQPHGAFYCSLFPCIIPCSLELLRRAWAAHSMAAFTWQLRAPGTSVSVTLIQKSHRVIFMAFGRSSESLKSPDSNKGDWTHLTLVKCIPHSQMFRNAEWFAKAWQVAGFPFSLWPLTTFLFSLINYGLALSAVFLPHKHMRLKWWSLRSLSLLHIFL